MKQTFWQKIEGVPPILCRLLARSGGGRYADRILTDEEIASRAGLRISEVKSLSWKTSWEDVPHGLVRRFSLACGVDFTDINNLKKHKRMIMREARSFWHIRKSPDRQRYMEMLRVWWKDKEMEKKQK